MWRRGWNGTSCLLDTSEEDPEPGVTKKRNREKVVSESRARLPSRGWEPCGLCALNCVMGANHPPSSSRSGRPCWWQAVQDESQRQRMETGRWLGAKQGDRSPNQCWCATGNTQGALTGDRPEGLRGRHPSVVSLCPMRAKSLCPFSRGEMEAQRVTATCPCTGVRGRAPIQTKWPAPEYAMLMFQRNWKKTGKQSCFKEREKMWTGFGKLPWDSRESKVTWFNTGQHPQQKQQDRKARKGAASTEHWQLRHDPPPLTSARMHPGSTEDTLQTSDLTPAATDLDVAALVLLVPEFHLQTGIYLLCSSALSAGFWSLCPSSAGICCSPPTQIPNSLFSAPDWESKPNYWLFPNDPHLDRSAWDLDRSLILYLSPCQQFTRILSRPSEHDSK